MNIKMLIAAGILAAGTISAPVWAQEVLKVGVEALYPPFESKTPDGKLVGFDVELNDAVCARLQVKCEWVETSFDGLIPALNARKFNYINSAMNITEPRQKVIDFTVPIYDVPSQLIAKKGSGLQATPESLQSTVVGVLQGSAQEAFVKKHWAPKGVKIVSYASQDQIYQDLRSNRIQAAVQKTPSAVSAFLDKPEGKDYEVTGAPLDDTSVLGVGTGFGIRKGNDELKKRLDGAIDALKKDGTISKLTQKYFNADWVAK
ncbi:transporter substrate-binding domain-containing protein [Advenella mimigardefordensis]|uniref:Putative amino acid-binding protein n=1 Tax=Advenella mimigardefordensis (strain DSM 17166 / LMG 22922 / DPN7) TaxID=1247726 RepID=W0P9A3_ADVMD|nr:transporter substrate-binding domain-containing protein [Advenella mimigardefordensis]AHG63286.1 putative amino acid-binding protein [Advenella mimigardefordensis DPN7]